MIMDRCELSDAKMAFESIRDTIDHFQPHLEYDMPEIEPILRKIDKYLKLVCKKLILLETNNEFILKQEKAEKFQREFARLNPTFDIFAHMPK